jgi:hypothetical protein
MRYTFATDGWRCVAEDDGQRLATTGDCVLSTLPGGVLVQSRRDGLVPRAVLHWLLTGWPPGPCCPNCKTPMVGDLPTKCPGCGCAFFRRDE